MHAQGIVRRFIETHLILVHGSRRQVLAAAVYALMQGQFLSLSRLARGVMGGAGLKAALKRIDRFVGHRRIEQEAKVIGATLVARLAAHSAALVIAVDWSAVGPGGKFVELRASVTRLGMGRGLTVYQKVYPEAKLGNPRAERQLLDTLHRWIDGRTEVIVVTDAGFRRPWFTHVEKLGWGWIGRVRGKTYLACAPSPATACWRSAATWFAQATGQARRWVDCLLTKQAAWPCDVVLLRRRRVGRKHYRCPGRGSTPKAAGEARRSAHEPWLLVHSARLRVYRADEIVALYAQRMQIEENFRDCKSTAFGMGHEISRSRSALRLHALLMLATLAAFLLWHIGQLAEAEGVHRRFKVTTRAARELSIITLARLLCASPHRLPLSDLAIHSLFQSLGVRL